MFLRLFAITVFTSIIGLAGTAHADSFAEHFTARTPPQPAPALTFEDDKGREVSLKDFKGRYILLNLWATWCQPCAHEMPTLDALRQKLKDKPFDIIALTEDHDGLSAAQAFYQHHDLHMPLFVDSGGHAPTILHAHGLPTTLFIDPNGMEIGRIEGEADWTSPDALVFMNAWLKKNN